MYDKGIIYTRTAKLSKQQKFKSAEILNNFFVSITKNLKLSKFSEYESLIDKIKGK